MGVFVGDVFSITRTIVAHKSELNDAEPSEPSRMTSISALSIIENKEVVVEKKSSLLVPEKIMNAKRTNARNIGNSGLTIERSLITLLVAHTQCCV